MKKLYILGTDKDGMGRGDGVYSLLADDGEHMASHMCSNAFYAQSDLHDRRPERKEEWSKRFGEYEVVWLGSDEMTLETLIERNKEWFAKSSKEEKDKSAENQTSVKMVIE